MYAQSMQSSGGSFGTGALVGAAGGVGASAALMAFRKTQFRANVGMGTGIAALGIPIIGGNNNNTLAQTVANQVNTINALTVDAAPTGAQVAPIRAQLATLAGYVSQIASNTDPLTVVGLRNAPTIPAATTTLVGGAAVSTLPSSGIGNLGMLLLGGLVIYLAVRD